MLSFSTRPSARKLKIQALCDEVNFKMDKFQTLTSEVDKARLLQDIIRLRSQLESYKP